MSVWIKLTKKKNTWVGATEKEGWSTQNRARNYSFSNVDKWYINQPEYVLENSRIKFSEVKTDQISARTTNLVLINKRKRSLMNFDVPTDLWMKQCLAIYES